MTNVIPTTSQPFSLKSFPNIGIIGHRGSRGEGGVVENTIPAYSHAFQHGAMAVELDVHLSKDGIPVVLHNSDLAETPFSPKTEQGQNQVGDYRAEDLTQAVYIPSKLKVPDVSLPSSGAFQIPTLEAVFNWFQSTILKPLSPTAVHPKLFVELKNPDSQGQLAHTVLDLIKAKGLQQDVVVISFDRHAIAQTRKMAQAEGISGLETGWDLHSWLTPILQKIPSVPQWIIQQLGIDYLLPDYENVTPDFLKKYDQLKIIPWVPHSDLAQERDNDFPKLLALAQQHPNLVGIITNQPEALHHQLNRP